MRCPPSAFLSKKTFPLCATVYAGSVGIEKKPLTDCAKKSMLGSYKLVFPPMTETTEIEDPQTRREKADDKLTAFICGDEPLVLEDGTEHWFDADGGRTYTLNEISIVMGVTRERVRQIQQKALQKMYAKMSAMARKEGENPVEWFTHLMGELDARNDGGHEYET
jgi:hypothetical protein